jgi:hypothetical protein
MDGSKPDSDDGQARQASNIPSMHPKRRHTRHPVDTGAVIRLIGLAAKVEGRILDLSIGGCRIRTNLPFPLGVFRRVETQFRIDGMPFRLSGVTQAIYDPFNVGIRFLDVSDRMQERLERLIEEIKESRKLNHHL